jgi:hypothetical protein
MWDLSSGVDCHSLGHNNGSIKIIFKPEAGSCGYGCVQQYDNYCTNYQKSTLNQKNKECMFGPNILDKVNHMHFESKYCDDSWASQYQTSLALNGNALAKHEKKLRHVPTIKDFDYARITSVEAKII